MAAASTDKFLYVGDPGTATNLAGSGYTIGGTSITVTTTTGWPTATGVIFGIDVVETDSNGEEVRVEGSYCIFAGVVTSGTTIGSVTKLFGTDQNYTAGATTRVYITVSSYHNKRLIEGLLTSLDQDGTLKAGAVDNAAVLASNVVTTAKILNANVTPDKLGTGAAEGTVTGANETSTSTSYTDLATTTDTVTITVGANGLALVNLYCGLFYNSNSTQRTFVGFAVSGATTVAANDNRALQILTTGAGVPQVGLGSPFLVTGLTPGSTTFKMKYRVDGGTGNWQHRRISVVPL